MMEYTGEWWIAGTNNKCFGTLKQYDDDEYMLEVFDKDQTTIDIFDKKSEGIVNIHGLTKEGKSISLFDFFCVSSSFQYSMVQKKYKGYRVVIADNEYYNSKEEIKIKKVTFRCDYLEEWMHKSLAAFKRENEGDMQLDIKMIDNEIYRANDFELKFHYGYKSHMNNTFTNYTWEQRNSISTIFDKEKNLIEVMDFIYSFCDFLSFCIGKSVKYKEVRCEDINGEDINIVDRNTEEDIKNVDLWEIERSLIIYNDIKDNFENIIKQWFDKKDRLQPIINKIISCDRDTKTFIVQTNFVDMVVALETFSRRFVNNTKVDQSEYNVLLEKMLNSIEDENFKKLMTKKLAYSNEPSLYDRLKNIFDKFPDIINLSGTKKKSLIHKSVNTRNYYTHFGEDKKPEDILGVTKASYAYEVYKIILKLLILEEIDVDTDKIIGRQKKVHNGCFRYISTFQKIFNAPKK